MWLDERRRAGERTLGETFGEIVAGDTEEGETEFCEEGNGEVVDC